jgi:hypothetical protein
MKTLLLFSMLPALLLNQAICPLSSARAGESPPHQEVSSLTTLREQRIYVPYERLREVLQGKDKGVLIPYSDFVRLWEQATRKPPEQRLPPPPVDAAIIHAEYRGTVHNGMAEFVGELKVSALKEKWGRLLLNFKNVAITGARLNGKPPLLKTVPQGLELVLPEKGDYDLSVAFSARVQTLPGKRFIDVLVPSAPLTKIHMTIPGEDLDVQIDPMLSRKSAVINGNTEFSVFLPPEGHVKISWLAKLIEAKALPSQVFANLFSELHIRESVNLVTTRIDFSIMQAKTDTFRIRIPDPLSLVRVAGENIRDWDMGDGGILTVTLYEKIDGHYALSILTEAYRERQEGSLDFPQLEALDAKREDGIMVIKVDPSLRVKVEKRDRVTQIDPSELRGRTTLENFVSAFRYFRRPYLLRLAVSRIQPRIIAHQTILITFAETMIDYHAQVHFMVKDAGVFEFSFLMPDGFRVTEVGTEKTVESYSVLPEGGRRILKVLLKNKAFGDYRLPVHLEADKEDKRRSLTLPKLACMGVEKEDGIIALSLRKNLKLSTEKTKSLRPISLEELGALGFSKKDETNVLAAGYRYWTTDYACILNIEKRETKLLASVERNIHLDATAIKLKDTIRYDILYAPVRQFRLELPATIGKDAVIVGDHIKEKRFIVDEKEETGVWFIELHGPQLDRYSLSVTMEEKLPEVKVGETRDIPVPRLRILDVFHESGYISVGKSPDLQVDGAEENLEPIDSKELPPTMDRSQSVLAFKYLSHPYCLTLQSTKHEFEKVLDAIVNEAHYDIVVSREGIAKTEGVLRIQNMSRQSLEIILPEGTRNIYSVFISGRKASISRGSSERSKIVMLGNHTRPGQEFTLRIIYESGFGHAFGMVGRLHVESAEIIEVPMSKITWRLYLPDRYSYLYMKGSMDPRGRMVPRFADVNASAYSQRIHPQSRITLGKQELPQQEDEKTLVGLDMDLVREGRRYVLSKLDKGAFLHVHYMDKGVLFKVSVVLVGLVASIILYLLHRRKPNAVPFFVGSGIAALLVRVSLPQGFKVFASLVLLGIAISAVVPLGHYLYGRIPSRGDPEKRDESGRGGQ